jgi:hypothetical protein
MAGRVRRRAAEGALSGARAYCQRRGVSRLLPVMCSHTRCASAMLQFPLPCLHAGKSALHDMAAIGMRDCHEQASSTAFVHVVDIDSRHTRNPY